MKTALAILAFCAPAQEGGGARQNPLKPLGTIAKQLDERMTLFLKGTDPAEAFKPWSGSVKDAAKLRESLKAAGVETAVCFGLEFELTLYCEDRAVYHVRTVLWMTEEDATILSLRGEAAKEEMSKTRPLTDYSGDLAPFAQAAGGLFSALKSKNAAEIPIADGEKLAKLLPESMHAKVRADIETSRKTAARIVGEIADLRPDRASLRLDDVSFLGKDSSAAPKGFLKGEFDFKAKSFEFEIGSFKAFKR